MLKAPSPLALSHPKPPRPISPTLTSWEPVACSVRGDSASAAELRGGINSEREELASAQPNPAQPGQHASSFPREYCSRHPAKFGLTPPSSLPADTGVEGNAGGQTGGWKIAAFGWFIREISMESAGFGAGLEILENCSAWMVYSRNTDGIGRVWGSSGNLRVRALGEEKMLLALASCSSKSIIL